MLLLLFQEYPVAIGILLAMWVFGCAYIRTTPSVAYGCNVAAFSAALIMLGSECVLPLPPAM